MSPSKFESQATGSPTKLSVPNRKIRNQPSNRVHDIEFAAEISTSLIAQVRNLQSLLAERDEEVRDLKNEKSSLEIESEGLQQRLKTLDESEHRYKEENWNLETKLQETSSQQREASDREKKLTQALNASILEKNAAQKELDEVKLSHAKLSEEHAASIKHHDIELGTAKRSAVMAEGERAALQRKIDDLTNQNQELARAFSTQRGRTKGTVCWGKRARSSIIMGIWVRGSCFKCCLDMILGGRGLTIRGTVSILTLCFRIRLTSILPVGSLS